MNTQHKETEAYTERHIDQLSIVVVHKTQTPVNNFQKRVCDVLYGALHGLVFPSDDFQQLKRNVLTVLQHIDKVCPRKGRRISTVYSELGTDIMGRLMRANNLDIGEIVKSKDIFERVCVIEFMPIQGSLLKNEVGEPNLFAYPLSSDRIIFADYYNNIVEQEGGEK